MDVDKYKLLSLETPYKSRVLRTTTKDFEQQIGGHPFRRSDD
jgi:hypothetical protein